MGKKVSEFSFFLKPISCGLKQCPKSQISKQSQAGFCRLKVMLAKCFHWSILISGVFPMKGGDSPSCRWLERLAGDGDRPVHNHLQIRLA